MAVDRRLLCPDPADRSLRRAVAAISQLVAGGRYSSQRGNRAAYLARPLGIRWTRGGTLGPSARGHPPHLHRRGGCPVVLGLAARDLPVAIRYLVTIPAGRSAFAGGQRLPVRHFGSGRP